MTPLLPAVSKWVSRLPVSKARGRKLGVYMRNRHRQTVENCNADEYKAALHHSTRRYCGATSGTLSAHAVQRAAPLGGCQ